jgi:hypothetical protein
VTARDDAGLVWEVLQRFSDPASGMFDAILAASDLDPDTARALRFWQRESVYSIKQYAAHTIPTLFQTLADAQADAHSAAVRAEETLRAGGRLPSSAPTIVLPDAAPHDPGALLDERRRAVAARLAQLSAER